METIKEEYTRKVSGEVFCYELDFTPGIEAVWLARVYRDGLLKGTPHGSLADNELSGIGLQQYLIGYVEAMIERGLDVDE